MQTLSKDEMKDFRGGVATTVYMPVGDRQYGGHCYVDFCYVNVETGAVSGCTCDVEVACI
jgi:hypothetical protein